MFAAIFEFRSKEPMAAARGAELDTSHPRRDTAIYYLVTRKKRGNKSSAFLAALSSCFQRKSPVDRPLRSADAFRPSSYFFKKINKNTVMIVIRKYRS